MLGLQTEDFRRVGSDAVIYGPGEFERVHSYDERVKVNDIKVAARVELIEYSNLSLLILILFFAMPNNFFFFHS